MSAREIPGIIAEFLDEAAGYLDSMNSILLEMERDVAALDGERLDTMYRAAHSLKGLSAMLGYPKINLLTHKLESVFDRIRRKTLGLSSSNVESLFGAFDMLSALIAEISQPEQGEVDPADTMAKLESLLSDAPSGGESRGEAEGASKYLRLFLAETAEELEQMQEGLLALEKDPGNRELLDDVFRMAHRIKGSSGSMGFEAMNSLTHALESVLDAVRNNRVALRETVMTVFYETADMLRAFHAAYGEGRPADLPAEPLREKLQALLRDGAPPPAKASLPAPRLRMDELEPALQAKLRQARDLGLGSYRVALRFECEPRLAGMRAFLVAAKLRELGEVVKTCPDEAMFMEEDCPVEFSALLISGESMAAVAHAVQVDQVADVKVDEFGGRSESRKPAAPGTPAAVKKAATADAPAPQDAAAQAQAQAALMRSATGGGTLRVDIERLDLILNLAGELVISKARILSLARTMNDSLAGRRKTQNLMQRLVEQVNQMETAGADGVDDVWRRRAASLSGDMRLFQDELQAVLQQDKLVHRLNEAVYELERISSSIQSGVMSTRMVPIGPLFGRYKRVVRDLAKKRGMQVDLELQGELTELDKNVIDELGDPLTHIVRNAVDHGIESPDERAAAGKSPAGRVRMKAYYQGSSICVDVEDDGRGLDPHQIAAKAVEKGILSEARAAEMKDQEKIELIFLPGFSTAEKVTDVSGRGLGMDIVRRKIESLKGTLNIRSEVGKGTAFSIVLPLTLAIIKAILFRAGEIVYAAPIEAVHEILQVRPEQVHEVHGSLALKVRGNIVGLARLTEVFGGVEAAAATIDGMAGDQIALIVGMYGREVALLVDELVGEEDIVVKNLHEHFRQVEGLSGASIMGDGTVSLILDVQYILDHAARGA